MSAAQYWAGHPDELIPSILMKNKKIGHHCSGGFNFFVELV